VLVDKPAGITSHDAVRRVRRALGGPPAGHTGTLDPFATGLLVVLVGRATRLARFVEGRPKRYAAEARLGWATDTDDVSGTPLGPPVPVAVTAHAVAEALASLAGRQLQRPPAFSAKHVAGQRSYRLARRGEAVPLAPVEVEVHEIALRRFDGEQVSFSVTVSAGTYVRALARDLGERLGTGAHLTALRREAIGTLEVADAVPLDAVSGAALRPPLAVLPHLALEEIGEADAQAIRHGRAVAGAGEGTIGLVHQGALLAIGEGAAGLIQPRVVLEEP
jgi:tRNA pseudouridine55 synthase